MAIKVFFKIHTKFTILFLFLLFLFHFMKSSDIDSRRSSRRKSSFSGISIAPNGLYGPPRASIHIERQLNSLLEENKEDDAIHLLQDNFSNLDIRSVNSNSSSKVEQRHGSVSASVFFFYIIKKTLANTKFTTAIILLRCR